MTAWAFASLRNYAGPLLDAISSKSIASLSQVPVHSLANMAWSVAPLQYEDQPCMASIAASAIPRCQDYRPHTLAGTAWSMAACLFVSPPLRESIAASAIRIIRAEDQSLIAASAWADAPILCAPAPLLDAIAAAAIPNIQLCTENKIKRHDLSTMSRAFWLLSQHDDLWDNIVAGGLPGWMGPRVKDVGDGSTRRPLPKTSEEVAGVTDRRFQGHIARISQDSGFAFIRCKELQKRHVGDVFVGSGDLGVFELGDAVQFSVIITAKGKPQAVNIQAGACEETITAAGDGGEDVIAKDLARRGYWIQDLGDCRGDGKTYPHCGDQVRIAYIGRLLASGHPFEAREDFVFTLGAGAVIEGLEKGLQELSLGQAARLLVHHSYAYGGCRAPTPCPIPTFADLDFSLKLLGIERRFENAEEDTPYD